MRIREASSDADLDAIAALRYDVCVREFEWPVEGADHERGRLPDTEVSDAAVLLAEDEEQIAGTIRIVYSGASGFPAKTRETYAIDRFAELVPEAEIAIVDRAVVRDRHRRGPVVPTLLHAGVERMVARGVRYGLGDAEPHLVLMWERVGARPYTAPFNYPAGGVAIPLAIVLERHHLDSIQSPFADLLDPASGSAEDAARLTRPLAAGSPVLSPITEPSSYAGTVLDALRAAGPGGGVDPDHLAPALGESFAIRIPPGLTLISPDQYQRTVYVVAEGSVDVLSAGARVGGSGPGAVVGEVAFLLGTARMNQVVAGRDGAFVLGFSSAALTDAVERDPEIGAGLYRALAVNLAHKLLERQGRAPRRAG